jgi:hypothetical protein
MSDTPAPPAPPAPDKPKAAKAAAKADRGVHVVFDKDGRVVTIFSGEVDSLREAVKIGGTARHVRFGERLQAETSK